jgi:NtrC-family two-component system response regulator AlgB
LPALRAIRAFIEQQPFFFSQVIPNGGSATPLRRHFICRLRYSTVFLSGTVSTAQGTMAETKIDPRALRILIIDDDEHIRYAMTLCLEDEGHEVVAVGTIEDALDQTARLAFDLMFLDIRLGTKNGLDYLPSLREENPWARIIVITAYGSIETAVEAMKLGATDFLSKPFEPTQLTLRTQKVAERRMLERNMDALHKTIGSMDPEADFPTANSIYRESIELARRLATANSPILIQGEAGTGRGRLARAIHYWSSRRDNPIISVACEAQSVDSLEAELFGAIPGSSGQIGAIAMCHGGTLLLDEVGNMPMRLQHKLLNVIRDKEFERQDDSSPRPVNVRIIATTSADLRQAVDRGQFRPDLLLALNVAQIDIPALRQRPEDILMLALQYLSFFSREHHKSITGFSSDASFMLSSHRWPGNSRELRNVVERAVLACNSDLIGLEHLPADLLHAASHDHNAINGYKIGDLVPLEMIEEAHIQKVLASTKTIRRAAAVLGVNASTLCRRFKRKLNEDQDEKLAE